MKQLRGVYVQTFLTFRTVLVQRPVVDVEASHCLCA